MNVFGATGKVEEYGTPHSDATDVEGVVVAGYDPAIDKWLALEWHDSKTIWLTGGGKESDESFDQVAIHELKEETGYTQLREQVQLGGAMRSYYYNDKKGLYRRSNSYAFLFVMDSTVRGEQELEAHEKFDVGWLHYAELRDALCNTGGGVEHWLAVLAKARDYVMKTSVTG